MFKGSITALVTPFKNNKLDEDSYEKFIEFQILMELMELFQEVRQENRQL